MSRYSRPQCQRCGVDIFDGNPRLCVVCWSEEEEALLEAMQGYDEYPTELKEIDPDLMVDEGL